MFPVGRGENFQPHRHLRFRPAAPVFSEHMPARLFDPLAINVCKRGPWAKRLTVGRPAFTPDAPTVATSVLARERWNSCSEESTRKLASQQGISKLDAPRVGGTLRRVAQNLPISTHGQRNGLSVDEGRIVQGWRAAWLLVGKIG